MIGKSFKQAVLVAFGSFGLTVAEAAPTNAEPELLLSAEELRDAFLGVGNNVDLMSVGAIPKTDEVSKYCVSIFDQAKEARHAVLMRRLQEMQSTVDGKLDEMDERIVQLKTWTEKREKFLAMANESLIQIFQTMRSESAALQMTEMGPVMSAAIIAKLEPKFSSAILAEMEPGDAAKVTLVLTDSVGINE